MESDVHNKLYFPNDFWLNGKTYRCISIHLITIRCHRKYQVLSSVGTSETGFQWMGGEGMSVIGIEGYGRDRHGGVRSRKAWRGGVRPRW